jgi:hypothetical protein
MCSQEGLRDEARQILDEMKVKEAYDEEKQQLVDNPRIIDVDGHQISFCAVTNEDVNDLTTGVGRAYEALLAFDEYNTKQTRQEMDSFLWESKLSRHDWFRQQERLKSLYEARIKVKGILIKELRQAKRASGWVMY